MQAQNHGLISRPSSITLSLAERPVYVPAGSSDDLVITQSLLGGPRNLSKRTSFHEIPVGVLNFNGRAAQDESSDSESGVPQAGRNRKKFGTSNTWTSSSAEIPSEQDEIDDRVTFVQEYNRLAKKHGVRSMVVEDFPSDNLEYYGKAGSWFSRNILRRTSSSQSIRLKTDRTLRHKRSISDISLRLKSKHDKLKYKDLQELVRLCGSSLLYLPSEYAVGSLAVPTCFRATAQYLVQYAPTARGVFRIPGSHGTVSLLYNHFCAFDDGGDLVSGTVRCPTLPDHIPCDVHDVASAFKKFISGLPGGVLGSLRLFDALISIQTQLHSDPELTRTKQSKVRARLLALAIFTLKSQYRRDLICAVFGLLCMIGRAAETYKREDERGRPLPTSNLMGYGPLGIVFGPLLVGDLLETYTMRLANPRGGLILLPISPPKSRKERQKEKQIKQKTEDNSVSFNSFVDKIKVANGVTEMLITHWRDVVRHMRNLKTMKPLISQKSLAVLEIRRPVLRPSASDTFAIRRPPDWDDIKPQKPLDGHASPTPAGRRNLYVFSQSANDIEAQNQDLVNLRKQKLKNRPLSSQLLNGSRSLSILSPTKERSREELGELDDFHLSHERGLKGKRKEHESSSISSRHSKFSRKDDGFETPSKLRKPRPPQNMKDANLSISKTRSKDAKDARLSRLNPTINDKAQLSPARKDPQRLLFEPNHLSQCKKAGLLNAKSLQPSTGTKISRNPHIPEGMVSHRIRRIAATEPFPKKFSLGSPRRLASKTVDVDSSGRSKVFNGSLYPKDPLSLVSNEEDVASLEALAKVLGNENGRTISKELDDLSIVSKREHSSTENLQSKFLDSQSDRNSKEYTISSSLSNAPPQKRYLDRGSSNTSMQSSSAGMMKGSQSASLFMRIYTSHETKTSSDNSDVRGPPPTSALKHITVPRNPVKRFNSPGHSVKALAAKFNTAEITNSFESPTKMSPTKLIAKDASPYQMRKDNLLGEYTTNTPSPARSQKSLISERINRRPIGELPLVTQPVNTSARKTVTPKHSSSESAPLRSSNDEPSAGAKFIQNIAYSDPAAKFLGSIARTFDGHASSQADTQRSQSTLLTITAGSEALIGTEDAASASEVVSEKALESAESPFVHFPSIKFGSDGPRTTEKNESEEAATEYVDPRLLDSTKSPHVHFASIDYGSETVLLESVSQRAISMSHSPIPSVIPSETPLSHSSSILHTKIRDLQKHLAVKSDEVRQLRQQLDARANLDIGTLSAQLREAKKESLAWKLRAEISEKQVEMLSKRTVRRKLSFRVSAVQEKVVELRTMTSEEDNAGQENSRRALHGMDGAGASRDWNSDETNATVIREVKDRDEARYESEYSVWMRHKMRDFGGHDHGMG